MAGVNCLENQTADQLRLIAGLRWRIFVNLLRTRRGKADLAGRAVAGSFIGCGALGIGVLLAVGSWAGFHQNIPLLLPAALWFVFLAWQLLPVFITGFGAQADSSLLLRFPLRYSAFVALTLAYGLADPVTVAALFWLVMILAGIAVAAPGALLWAIPALFLFSIVNLLLSRAVFAWLDRWLARRRTREILGIGFFVLMMSFQLIRPLSERWGKRAVPTLARLTPIERPFPPGLAAYAVQSGHNGAAAPALLGLGGLLAFASGFGWLLGIRLRAQYRGENLSEAQREQAGRETTSVHRSWQLAGLSPVLAALVEKDLRYLLRNTAQYLNLAVPLILVFVFGLNGGTRARRSILGGAAFFPISVGYCLLVLSNLVYNSLGYDGAGVAMLFAAPVRFRDVLLSKNLLHGLLISIEILLVSILVSVLTGPPPPLTVVLTLAGALFVILLNFAAGNLLSLYFPRRLQFGTMRRQNQSGVAALTMFLVPGTAMGVATGVYGLCRWAGHAEWAVLALLGLAGVSFVVYQRVLAASCAIAGRKRDVIMEELCKG
ncbi:MAG TPA: hypothetical protein VG206_02025 [Terriglobia bacterium]|nr:hypothetical protein [Terriglobia bacterium]